ncbi:hypothetical protein CSPHI_09515 [Corynebacterium sphenisci DSM 44792]|uniref:Uncharacterized protein n=1 Tax=Corynebacterium sphenisci DSM 44792 TaxID=1437874 RepID=A0A1L7CZE5_9CORY|nr:hypothetical protein CSPHI_09515 [Corynebacterium sphenisci DSM 44792]
MNGPGPARRPRRRRRARRRIDPVPRGGAGADAAPTGRPARPGRAAPRRIGAEPETPEEAIGLDRGFWEAQRPPHWG